ALEHLVRLNYLYDYYFNRSDILYDDFLYSDYTLSKNVWLLRKSILLAMASLYVWWILTYRDITQVNYRLLSENTRMLRQIQNQLQSSPERKSCRSSITTRLTPLSFSAGVS